MFRFDCHAHVYETVTCVDGARYLPANAAPLADWQAHLARHALQGGVIVQVSFLGFDNSELVSALARLNPARFAGVAVVPLDVPEAELDRLMAAGVRGVRWNLVRGAMIPDTADPRVARFLDRLKARQLHLELHLEGPHLAPITRALLDHGLRVVVDHFGLPSRPDPDDEPWLQALSRMDDLSNLYVKFSAAYRTPFDVAPHAQALLDLLSPERIVWGSDWPHTQFEQKTGYDHVAAERATWPRIREEAAARVLYGIS